MNLAFDSSIVWTIESKIYFAIWVVLFVVKLFALCDAAFRRNQLFVATEKQTKVIWVAMLGVAMLFHIFAPAFTWEIIGAVPALVYLADVRPALRSMQSR